MADFKDIDLSKFSLEFDKNHSNNVNPNTRPYGEKCKGETRNKN